jgi:hypothetical protein
MTGFWLISFLVLWIVVLGLATIILALAREVEVLYKRVDSISRFNGISYDEENVDKNQSVIQQEKTEPVVVI